MQIKAILFDLDGVILDSEKIYAKYWKEVAEQLGYHLPMDTILSLRSCDSSIAKETIQRVTGRENSYSDIRVTRKQLMKEWMNHHNFSIKDGVKEFLQTTSKYNITRAIVTSALPDDKIKTLRDADILHYFEHIVSAKDIQRNKPYPDIYVYACSFLGLNPSECLAIEDSPNGVKSAFSAGVNVVMIPDLSQPDEELLTMCTALNNIKEVATLL